MSEKVAFQPHEGYSEIHRRGRMISNDNTSITKTAKGLEDSTELNKRPKSEL